MAVALLLRRTTLPQRLILRRVLNDVLVVERTLTWLPQVVVVGYEQKSALSLVAQARRQIPRSPNFGSGRASLFVSCKLSRKKRKLSM